MKTAIQTWTNNAGPRKAKPVIAALGAIVRTMREHIEIIGTGEGTPTVYWQPFAEPTPAILGLYNLLGEHFAWTLTVDNLVAVQSSAAETLKACRVLRPVEDKRQSADEVTKLAAARAEREAEASRANAERDAASAAILAKRPPWAKAIIIAELNEDQSDSQTDYFGHKTTRTVAIGWRKGDREDFKQLRAAAATFEPTKHLGPGCDIYTAIVVFSADVNGSGQHYYKGERSHWHTELYDIAKQDYGPPSFTTQVEAQEFIAKAGLPEPMGFGNATATFEWTIKRESVEHRDNFSMGGGNFLKRGGQNETGWRVKSQPIGETTRLSYGIEDGLPTEAAPPAAAELRLVPAWGVSS